MLSKNTITKEELKTKDLFDINIQYLESDGLYKNINHISNVTRYFLDDHGYVAIYYWDYINNSRSIYGLSEYVFSLSPGYNLNIIPS